MLRYILVLLAFIAFSVQAQQRVIIDTDIDSDVDDVGALAMLYNLHAQKKIHLLGVIVTSDDPYAPTCVSALNRYYEMDQLPIGFLENQPELKNHSRYTRQISEEYPHNLSSWEDAETATRTYRKLLAESPDNSVIIVTIGHLTSFQYLLQSLPDEYSSLNGKELVDAKVLKWYCMGGQFPSGKEANFYRPDPGSTVYSLANWEKEVVFCGWEVGNKIITGGEDVQTVLPSTHPVYRGYELYNNFAGRASWDQLAVMLLTDKASTYFEIDYNGTCKVEKDGSNTWIPGAKGNQGYLKIKNEQDIPAISAFISQLITGKDIQQTSYTPWEDKAVDFSHGALKISENGRFFSHADGTPFFYLADTAWELFHRLNEKEIDIYLEDRRKKGFNVIQAVILAEIDGLNSPDRNGNTPLLNNNPATPNEDYFKWVDKVILKAADKGIYMALLPTWGDKVDGKWGIGPVIFNPENAEIYSRYLANRYKDFPNIIWVVGGDRVGDGNNMPVWDAFAKGIRSIDKKNLITFHPNGRNTSGTWFHDRDWLDFNSSQTGHAHCSYDIFDRLIVTDYNRLPVKPVINMEPSYEDHPVRGETCDCLTWFDETNTRQALYWSLFSGAAGHAYGCHPVWQFMLPAYEPVGQVRNNWYDDLDLPGARQMIHARRLMESFDYYSRIPAQEIILSAQEDIGDWCIATRGKGYAFVYLPNGNPVEVSLEAIPDTSNLELSWYNPRTGEYSQIDKIPAKGSYKATPTSSGRGNDWVLIMKSL